MKPAVIIPSKTISNLVPCVAAVRQHDPDLSIIVVDDGIQWPPEKDDPLGWISVVRGESPFIFSRNINAGIRYAEAHKPLTDCGFLLLNDDALLQSPGGFSLLAAEAEAHPEFGIIGVTTNLTGQPLQFRRNVGLREVPHIAFVGVYIPKRTIEAVGYLDERYCLDYGCEDRDYCEAVTRAGLKVGVHDNCWVDHGSLVSSFRGGPEAQRSFAKNLALFNAKCRHCDRTGERFTAKAGTEVTA